MTDRPLTWIESRWEPGVGWVPYAVHIERADDDRGRVDGGALPPST